MQFLRRLVVAFAAGVMVFITFNSAMAKKKAPAAPAAPVAPTPAPDNSAAITADKQEITDDRTALTTAQKALDDAVAKDTTDFEKTPEFIAAKTAVDQATAALSSARSTIIDTVDGSDAYKTAQTKEAAARKELAALRDANASRDDIADKSAEVFKLGQVTNKLERDAMDADPSYLGAQKKQSDATVALAALRAKFKDGLKDDATLQPLRQARDDAKTKLNTAIAKLATDNSTGTASSGGGGTGSY